MKVNQMERDLLAMCEDNDTMFYAIEHYFKNKVYGCTGKSCQTCSEGKEASCNKEI